MKQKKKTVTATFHGVEFQMPVETAKKVLNIQRILKEQKLKGAKLT